MTNARRLLCASLVAAAIRCTAPEPPPTEPPPAVDPRRERLREELRSRLGERYEAALPAATPEDLRRGSKLYDTLCRACHGPTGKGNGRAALALPIQPADLADPRTAAFFSDQAKLEIITEGVAGTPMIAWGDILDERERIAVVQFMKTLIREPQAP